MMNAIGVAGVMVVVACSGTPPPQTAPAGGEGPQPVGSGFAQPPTDSDPSRGSAADATPVSAGPCSADATHCCMPDGRLVRPGGCQPSYPDNVQPGTTRGPDGRCVAVECHLRCLPDDAAIATPTGDVPVKRLAVGDLVWTADARGVRVAAPLVRIASISYEGDHSIVEVTLADGRVVRASASHPLVDGSLVGNVAIGGSLDGRAITNVRAVPYRGATWDLLPAGETGTYWSDGVRLGSTLRE